MTVQPFVPPTPMVGAPRSSEPASFEPVAVLENAQAPDRSFIARLWCAYCARRLAARMRNVAQDMDAHMLHDVGAPPWLINEVALRRDLAGLRNREYLRW